MSKKTRVKCANCGMIYDMVETEQGETTRPAIGCPECKSNAYDPLVTQPKHINPQYKPTEGQRKCRTQSAMSGVTKSPTRS